MSVSAQFSRQSPAVVHDYDGRVRNCSADEARFTGLRRVENLVVDSAHASTWAVASGATYIDGSTFAMPDALSNIEIHSRAVDVRSCDLTGYVSVSAASAESVGIDLILTLRSAALPFTALESITVTLTDTPVCYALSGKADDAYEWSSGAEILIESQTEVLTTIDVSEPQIEDVTLQTDKAPSPYVSIGVGANHGSNVDGVKYFDVENASTVDGSNIATFGDGAEITGDAIGLLVESAHEQLLHDSDDLTTGQWVINNTAVSRDPTTDGIDGRTPTLLSTTIDASYTNRIRQNMADTSFVEGLVYAGSLYIRPVNQSVPVGIEIYDITSGEIIGSVDLKNDAVTINPSHTETTTTTVHMTTLADGWRRVFFDFIAPPSNTGITFIISCVDNTLSDGDGIAHLYGPQVVQAENSLYCSYIENATTGTATRADDSLTYSNLDFGEDLTILIDAAIALNGAIIPESKWRLFHVDDSRGVNHSLRTLGSGTWAITSSSQGIIFGIKPSVISIDATPHKYGFTVSQSLEQYAVASTCFDGAIEADETLLVTLDYGNERSIKMLKFDDNSMPFAVLRKVEVHKEYMDNQQLIDAVNAL